MKPVKTVEELLELAQGYQRSMALFTALRLDVFSALSRGPADARELAGLLSADPGRLCILLNALVAMGLLRKDGARYRNAGPAGEFLAEGPRSRRYILLHHLDCWADWTGLEGKVRGGRRAPSAGTEFQENFIRGMQENARERAALIARKIRFRPGERVLDLGGGPGTYAVEWVRSSPGAVVTIFDMPETLRVTRKILRENGTLGRVRLLPGDFTRDRIGGPYDFVWISHILHAYDEKECIAILKNARGALGPGGRVAVQEFIVGENGTVPYGPAFFSLHMAAVTEGGKAYSVREIRSMLSAAGFRRIRADRPDPRGIGIVTADR